MKNLPVFILATAFAAAAAQAAPGDGVQAAAAKLADAPNYSWTTTTAIANSQFNIGPAEGKTEKGGYTVVTRSFNDNTMQSVRKGDQFVMQNPQSGEWMTAEELRQQFGGRGGFAGRAGPPNPAEEVVNLIDATKGLTAADGVISGDLTDEALARRLSFGRGGQDNPPPAPKNAMGTVKFWIQDGALVKFELHVKGTVTGRDGEEVDRDVTTTTVLKDVGTTKVEVPPEALKKLAAPAAAG